MKTRMTLAAAALCAAAGTGTVHAAAVQNGSYSGTQDNGAGISMTIGTDSNTGKPQISGFNISIVGNCTPTGTINDGWGFGPGTDFVGSAAHFTFGTDYFWVKIALTVSGNNVTGTVISRSAIFQSYTTAPTKSQFCNVPSQNFTMTYQSTTSEAKPATPQHFFTAH